MSERWIESRLFSRRNTVISLSSPPLSTVKRDIIFPPPTVKRAIIYPSPTVKRAIIYPPPTVKRAIIFPPPTVKRAIIYPPPTVKRAIIYPPPTVKRAIIYPPPTVKRAIIYPPTDGEESHHLPPTDGEESHHLPPPTVKRAITYFPDGEEPATARSLLLTRVLPQPQQQFNYACNQGFHIQDKPRPPTLTPSPPPISCQLSTKPTNPHLTHNKRASHVIQILIMC
nr:early nodulin-75-like [Procambarus clarkii]